MRRITIGFVFFTFAFICVTVLCAACIVRSRETLSDRELERWYRERETELVSDTRAYLNGGGFRDSGVSLTRVVSPEGERSYTFTIHHRRIDRMAESGRQRLREELAALAEDFVCAAPGESCEFRYEFLIVEGEL